MGNPKITVIIPVYNAQDYLNECIDSVLKQTMQDFEIVCIDDGSSDDSYPILKSYAETDKRVVVFSQTNQGVSAARNVGIENARGEYIYCLDSDDYIEPNMLEICVREMDNKSLDILYFDTYAFGEEGIPQNLVDEKNKYYSVKFNYNAVYTGRELLCKMRDNYDYSCPVWKQVIRKQFLMDNQVHFYQGIIHEDELYTLQTMLPAKRVEFIHQILHHRRLRENSIMTRPLGFDSVFGYFVCLKEAYKFLQKDEYTDAELSSLLSVLKSFYVNARNQYGKLPEQEQKKRNSLCENDKFLFNLAIADSLDLIRQRDKVMTEKQNLVRDCETAMKKLTETEQKAAKAEQDRTDVAKKLADAERKAAALEQDRTDVAKKLADAERKAAALEQDRTDVAKKLANAERKAAALEQDRTNVIRKLTELEEKYAKTEKDRVAIAGKLADAERKASVMEQDKTNVARKLTEAETILEQERKVAYKQLSEMSVKLVTAEHNLLQERTIYLKKLTELQKEKDN